MTAQRTPIFPDAPIANQPQEARWLIPKVNRMHAEELLGLVRILDDAMNNTSLILLLEIGETLILLPGDAQIENWRYALGTRPTPSRPAPAWPRPTSTRSATTAA